ncbi:MAG: serine/threonine protein kinase [Anaerolineae bacterium]|nr:serine/threonine protein kinase [Anaerolineae bacterium]
MQLSLEGQTLGKYRILEPLGRGGMARVYRAYHPQLDRYVAIKVLRPDLVEEEDFPTRFQREARHVATLRHANIVQIFDSDVEGDLYYMVMELLEGDTLKARLNDYRVRGERMPWGEIVRILLDVLDGLDYAHSEGMVHRDIKPANIMLTKRGQAVIGDFGIARMVGGTRYTLSGALMGTVSYIAPEQGLEGESDARSDLYSLGIVFYEMLTQHPPFEGDTPLAILMKHVSDPLPLPRQIDPEIPEAFERIVLKALAKRAEDRYQSAAEMAQALRDAAREAGIALVDRISQPLSFTTRDAPAEHVTVISGAARQKLQDAGFADDATDITLGKRLAVAQETGTQNPRGPQARNKEKPERAPREERKGVGRAIFTALMLVTTYNLLAVMFSGITRWKLYTNGWPIQLLVGGIGLCIIMITTRNRWLLIPVGIIIGNGIIFSYYAVTHNWELWEFFWPLEPILIMITLGITIYWPFRGQDDSKIVQSIGSALAIASFALSGLVALAAIIAP